MTEKELRENTIKKIRKIIKENYKKPKCYTENGCVYESALETFVCHKCIKWRTAMDIYIKVVSEV